MSDEYVSRSQKKRQSTAKQALGESLAALAPAQLARLDLPEDLLEALAEYRRMKSHEAKRRQMQYVGRVMRECVDEDTVRERLEELLAPSREEISRLHRLEAIRDQLLQAEADQVDSLLHDLGSSFPDLSESRVRHLLDQARADREKRRPPKAARELFRYLRTLDGQG